MEKFVVFDIDGVLADFEPFLVDYMDSVFSNLNHNRSEYSLKKRYPIVSVRETAARFVDDPNVYYAVPSNDGAFRFMEECLTTRLGVVILTSRPVSAETFTKRWLAREMGMRGMNYNDLLGVKFVPNKPAYLFPLRESLAFLVDDNPEEIEEAQRLGMTAYSWAQPWNERVFPKVFATRDGYTMYQKDEETDPVYFWGEERE